MILVIFRDFFQFLEINENKIIYNEKRKIFFGAEILKGYCPVCIVREKEKNLYCNVEIELQETGERAVEIVLQDGCFGLELYCNTVDGRLRGLAGWLYRNTTGLYCG